MKCGADKLSAKLEEVRSNLAAGEGQCIDGVEVDMGGY